MKKITILIAGIFLMLIVAGPTFAAEQTISTTNQSLTDTNGGGTGITNIDLSPNVTLKYNGAPDEYEMSTYNDKGTIEYGRFSGDTNIYYNPHEEPIEVSAMVAISTNDGTTVTGWSVLGGASTN